ncbi:11090_t:CDS:2 [Entrophospora sp. SA101]|nr:11090_t:CDS:2 [Entrophospora sp. SA101]
MENTDVTNFTRMDLIQFASDELITIEPFFNSRKFTISGQINKSTQEIQFNEEEFSIPKVDPVGYIHFYNRIGWKNFPLRVYHFFNSYKNFEIAGEEAVGIVLGKTRDFKNEDLDFGKDEEMFFKDELSEPKLDKRIANNLKIYTLGT